MSEPHPEAPALEAAQPQPDNRPERRVGLSRRAKIAGALALATVSLLAAKQAGLELFKREPDFDMEQDVDVTAIEAIDFGCFVRVEAEVEQAGHKRNVLHTPLFSKTVSTDTTETMVRGDSELCVDNRHTEIIPTKDGRLLVTIGDLFANRPRINHNGDNEITAEPSLLTRVGKLGGSSNGDVVEALNTVGQWVIGQAACVDQAVEVAQGQIQAHYDELGATFGYSDVEIVYKQTAESGDIPQGRANEFLESVGFEITGDLDIDVQAPRCNATMINGEPAVTQEQPVA